MLFEKAKPVWVEELKDEKNCELSFQAVVSASESAEIRIATSGEYQLLVNGEFVAFGPAKAAKGYFKVDTIDLNPYLNQAQNTVVLNVLCARINSFSLMDQPSFIASEILVNGCVAFWTDESGNFPAWHRDYRIQKVQRYSYQRTFTEAYRMNPEAMRFEVQQTEKESCPLKRTEVKRLLPRDVRYPQYMRTKAREIGFGKVVFSGKPTQKYMDRAYTKIGPKLRGFTIDQLEERLAEEAMAFSYQAEGVQQQDTHVENAYILCEFPINLSGFLHLEVDCAADCVVYALFDEILTDGDVDFLRLGTCNCVKFYLNAGHYTLRSFQPYTMKYLKIIVRGSAEIRDVSIIQMKHPQPEWSVKIPPEQPELKRIADAALESFQQNAIDFFYDCPSRERAGWLCDSFFTARVEKLLTGESVLEKAFLRNFLLPETFEFIPEGMLPMCYPSDHDNVEYIPNWAMWFVLELEEYQRRSGDQELVALAKSRVLALLDWLRKYENSDGLLECLPGWIFVEWSKANDWVRDVNFPTNMLYARMLKAVERLYGMSELSEKRQRLVKTIRHRSFNGHFFTDHEVIENGRYVNPGHMSEVCQYYAFFFEIATPQELPDLWDTLVRDFGPNRPAECWPDVAPANAFVGDYMRLELLYQNGLTEKLLKDIRDYFLPMAECTGTLWENNKPYASCCHGFASHVLYWLGGIYGVKAD